MATNLAIDQHLLKKAQKVGHHKTKRETVNAALNEYVRHHNQLKILDLFGKVDFLKGYDHKQGRKNRERSN